MLNFGMRSITKTAAAKNVSVNHAHVLSTMVLLPLDENQVKNGPGIMLVLKKVATVVSHALVTL